MSCDAIICDWNGTIINQKDESPVFRQLAFDLFLDYLPFHPFRIVHLLKTRKELEALYQERRYDTDFDFVVELFKVYNQKIIKGLPVPFVHHSVNKYAAKRQTLEKLDQRLLRPLAERHRAGVTTGILSAGYSYSIQAILKSAGYGDCFDFCEANQLSESEGRAIAFELNIYKNKPQFLLKLLSDRNLDTTMVAYIGDSDDDGGCLEMVGYPVVAFLAPEELKQKYAQKYRAFVPAGEADLIKYFQSL